MSLKFDMSKAYEKIEWKLLECMLRQLGFGEQCISLIMTYVTSVSYSMLINGQPYEENLSY